MTELTHITCWCSLEFAMPTRLYRSCRDDAKQCFYCPLGHSNVFRESEADKLRRERDRLKQDQARLHDRIREEREAKEAVQRSANAYKGQATKLRNRAAAGVCPCCNRQFQNLHRHMKTQHPNFGPDEDAQLKVIEGGKKTA